MAGWATVFLRSITVALVSLESRILRANTVIFREALFCWRKRLCYSSPSASCFSVKMAAISETSPPPGRAGIEKEEATAEGGSKQSRDLDEESHDVETKSCDSGDEGAMASDERYSYIQKGFTTEVYKIEINNLPQYVGYKQIKKHLKSLNLKPVKIKKPKKTFCFVTFRSEEDKEAALQALNGVVWKKKTLSAKVAAPAMDPAFKRKRKASLLLGEASDNESDAKRSCRESLQEKSLEDRLAAAVTPLLWKTYEEQLQLKYSSMEDFLRKAVKAIQKRDADPGMWFAEHVEECSGLMCPIEPIRSSPVQSEYRNKCEFSVAVSPDGLPVVGFRLASYEEGDFTVVSPESCVHIPQNMKDLARVFQDYFRKSSLPPFNHIMGTGHWKQVAIRCYRTGESMAIVQMHPQQLTQDELQAEKKRLAEHFTGSGLSPSSLFFQSFSRKITGSDKPDYEHVLGEKYVHESLLGMRFRISPDAFFQVNTLATEVLYSLVKELCTTTKPSIVYDICCGTGTIGLILAKAPFAKQVVGVEIVEQAVEDAKVNAQLNSVTNAEFLCGKAEDVLPKCLEKPFSFGGHEVIGVVDPPRNGLHPRVVQVIRRCSAIQRLVYVSCHPEGALGNIVDLTRRESNRVKGLPFRPVRAVPVDLFPHTRHCELVILFERVKRDVLEATSSREAGHRKYSTTDEDGSSIQQTD